MAPAILPALALPPRPLPPRTLTLAPSPGARACAGAPPPPRAPAPAPAPPAPAAAPLDALLFHAATAVAALLRLLARLLRRARLRARAPPPPPADGFPRHVALAGALGGRKQAARVAALARAAGAAEVTVFEPGGKGGRGGGAGGVRWVGGDAARGLALVRAARRLAGAAAADRGVDVGDGAALVRWLDRAAGAEPDVLLVFVDGATGVRCLGGFPVWGLRLTQICFVEAPVDRFGRDEMAAVAGGAARMGRRFGR